MIINLFCLSVLNGNALHPPVQAELLFTIYVLYYKNYNLKLSSFKVQNRWAISPFI